jgi:hypothetical protein
MTTPLALNLDNVWIRASSFANIGRAVVGNGADALGRRVYLQGFYMADDDNFDTWGTWENTYYQSTLFGFYALGPRDTWHDMSTSRHIIAICDPGSYDVYFGNLLVDVPIKHAWYAPNGAPSNVDGTAGVTIQSLQIAAANYTKPTNITYVENFNSAILMPAGTRGKNINIGTLSVSPYPGAPSENNFDYVVRIPTAANNPVNSVTIGRVLGTTGADELYWTSGVMPRVLHSETLADQTDLPTTISHTSTNIMVKVGAVNVLEFEATGTTAIKPITVLGGAGGTTMLELNREDGSPGRMGFGVSGDFMTFRNVEDNVIYGVAGGTASSVAWYLGNISGQASPRTANLVSEAASGENVGGADLTFRSGKGTGNAEPSFISFVVPAAGSSGSTAQTEATRLYLQEPTSLANGDTVAVVSGYDSSVPEWKVRRVVVGVADSGGAGFRSLRISN